MVIKVGLTGGGTGGHIYPCLAIAEALKTNYKEDIKLFYFGNPDKLEATLLAKDEVKDFSGQAYKDYIEFIGVNSEPLPKLNQAFAMLFWFRRFQKYTSAAKQLLKVKEIDIVFGTGGYAAGPVFAACKDLKIPYIIHNLDAHMGLANKLFVNDASVLTLGVCDLGIKPRNGQSIVTGNPISKSFLNSLSNRSNDKKDFHLLITGGSQGAQALNHAIGEVLPELVKLPIHITHVTGMKLYDDYVQTFLDGNAQQFSNYQVLPYTYEMPKLCSQATLAVCRAGAMTIAEMAVSGVVSIFVPLPSAAHDHQNLNADSLVQAGAAFKVDQREDDCSQQLLKIISNFVQDNYLRENMQDKLKGFARADAADKIAELLLKNN